VAALLTVAAAQAVAAGHSSEQRQYGANNVAEVAQSYGSSNMAKQVQSG
ncbi:MAG TPA: hypothetical protein DEQ55_13995, partial [Pseudomonas sp.]|nr:hypothetical protein [Pseudomonas sp.]